MTGQSRTATKWLQWHQWVEWSILTLVISLFTFRTLRRNLTCSWWYKTFLCIVTLAVTATWINFFGGNLDFPKIKKLTKVCSSVWTCTKMWKQLTLFLAKLLTLKLLIAFKMAYSCSFSSCNLQLRRNLDFLQKKFFNFDYRNGRFKILSASVYILNASGWFKPA